jgi:hypothetical protein
VKSSERTMSKAPQRCMRPAKETARPRRPRPELKQSAMVDARVGGTGNGRIHLMRVIAAALLEVLPFLEELFGDGERGSRRNSGTQKRSRTFP